jgi:diamine N-acetyltransferase
MYQPIETKTDISTVAQLAGEIWESHFGPMFEKDVLTYIIDKVQSENAISEYIHKGYKYHFIVRDTRRLGYFAYKIKKEKKELFLSKLYIISGERKKGIGRQVINDMEGMCKDNSLTKITLTVFHKNGGAIKAYEKIGFKNRGLIKRDIGNNIIIEDYEMEKIVGL